MKKVVENNNENSSKISDESNCDISGNVVMNLILV